MTEIDKYLLNFSNCDIFTPEKISKKMATYLKEEGELLEPSVGYGNLLKYIDLKYSFIIYMSAVNYLHSSVEKHVEGDKRETHEEFMIHGDKGFTAKYYHKDSKEEVREYNNDEYYTKPCTKLEDFNRPKNSFKCNE